VFFRGQKTQMPAPDKISGLRFFSVLQRVRSRILSLKRTPTSPDHISLSQDFRKQDCSPELHGLIDTLGAIRQKFLANVFLGGWAAWITWILIALIVVFSISAKLVIAIMLAGMLTVAGAAVILLWNWRTRLSTYQTACRVDAAAELQDRLSTAIYLGGVNSPGGMIERQRGDAIARIAKVDLSGKFPLRMPVAARRALVLFLAVGALYVYRLHHGPPLTALLQTTARSHLVQSILSPLMNALEKDVQRTMALVTAKPEALTDEARASESATSNDDPWQSNNDKNAGAKEDQQDSLDAGAGEAPKDQQQTPGDQNGSPSEQSRPQENNSQQSQNGKNAGDSSQGDSAKPSDSQGSQSSQESLGQSLMQALKNMMSDSPKQQSGNRENQKPQQQNSQGAPQSGNSHQPGSNESDKKGESKGNSDAEQKATNSASNGAGSQQGLKEMKKNQDTHSAAHAVPDRVALESSGFKEQTRMRIDTETGSAQLAVGDASSQSAAVINGAEQENIPPRYRLYVQRYFEHTNNGTR
jgi:hypothetical protein